MKSILKYIGQKDLDIFEDVKNSKLYCEPFSGSFNTGLNIIERGYTGDVILNDLDNKLVTFWSCLKENSDKTFERCITLKSSIDSCMTDDEKLRTLDIWYNKNDRYARAAAEYIYRMYNTLKGIKFNTRVGSINNADFYLQSLLLANVTINNKDAFDIIASIDSESTFMLIDPPYNVNNVDVYYRCNSSYFNHQGLFNSVKDIKSKFIIGYNKDEYILNMYKDFNIEEISHNVCGRKYIELLIRNY